MFVSFWKHFGNQNRLKPHLFAVNVHVGIDFSLILLGFWLPFRINFGFPNPSKIDFGSEVAPNVQIWIQTFRLASIRLDWLPHAQIGLQTLKLGSRRLDWPPDA